MASSNARIEQKKYADVSWGGLLRLTTVLARMRTSSPRLHVPIAKLTLTTTFQRLLFYGYTPKAFSPAETRSGEQRTRR